MAFLAVSWRCWNRAVENDDSCSQEVNKNPFIIVYKGLDKFLNGRIFYLQAFYREPCKFCHNTVHMSPCKFLPVSALECRVTRLQVLTTQTLRKLARSGFYTMPRRGRNVSMKYYALLQIRKKYKSCTLCCSKPCTVPQVRINERWICASFNR